MNDLKRAAVVFLLLSVALSAGVAYLFLNTVKEASIELGEFTTVFVAKQDIPVFSPVKPDMIEEKEIPKKFAHGSLILESSYLKDKVTTTPISKGGILTKETVQNQSDIPVDMRIVLLRAPKAIFDGNFSAGDVVDILITYEKADKTKSTEVLFNDVKLVSAYFDKQDNMQAAGVLVSVNAAPKLVLNLNTAIEVRLLKKHFTK